MSVFSKYIFKLYSKIQGLLKRYKVFQNHASFRKAKTSVAWSIIMNSYNLITNVSKYHNGTTNRKIYYQNCYSYHCTRITIKELLKHGINNAISLLKETIRNSSSAGKFDNVFNNVRREFDANPQRKQENQTTHNTEADFSSIANQFKTLNWNKLLNLFAKMFEPPQSNPDRTQMHAFKCARVEFTHQIDIAKHFLNWWWTRKLHAIGVDQCRGDKHAILWALAVSFVLSNFVFKETGNNLDQ